MTFSDTLKKSSRSQIVLVIKAQMVLNHLKVIGGHPHWESLPAGTQMFLEDRQNGNKKLLFFELHEWNYEVMNKTVEW